MLLVGVALCDHARATVEAQYVKDSHTLHRHSHETEQEWKKQIEEQYGLSWSFEAALGIWDMNDALRETPTWQGTFLIDTHVSQRILRTESIGDTYLRAEMILSLGMDAPTRRAAYNLNSSLSSYTIMQSEYLGGREFVLPQIIISQEVNKHLTINFGMINTTNFFDAVSIASNSFSSFTNSAFVNSTVLPLSISNLGILVEYQFNERSYIMVGASRTGIEAGYNPFSTGGAGDRDAAYIIEYGQQFAGDKGMFRLSPFISNTEEVDAAQLRKMRTNWGVTGSVEYQPIEEMRCFMRAGISAKDEFGAHAELSLGAHIHPFASRPDDYFGLAYGIFKVGDKEYPSSGKENEQVIEMMYRFSINENLYIAPHAQFFINPAYATPSQRDTEFVWGVQAVFSF